MTSEAARSALEAALQQARDMDAPLNERLAHYTAALRTHLAPFAEAVDRLVQRLEAVGSGTHAPAVGQRLPRFILPDSEGKLADLEELHHDQPLVVTFLRGHWCPYCQIQAAALATAHEQIVAAGADIVAITPETQRFLALHKSEAVAPFRMLSDVGNGYALSLNLAIWVGDEMKTVMSEFGRDLERYQGTPGWFLPIPATFVLDRNGIVTARFVDPDYRRRMDIAALLTAIAEAAAQPRARSISAKRSSDKSRDNSKT